MPAKVTEFNGSYYDLEIRKKAVSKVHTCIRNGSIIKPTKCEQCGSNTRLEGHHHKGYAEDNWLDVQWLCVKCHRSADGKRVKEARPPKLCKICGKPARRLQLCETHRTRLRRYGDPLLRRVKTVGEVWIIVSEAA